MKKYFKTFMLSICSIALLSCSNESQEEAAQGKLTLRKIYRENLLFREYIFDNNKNLTTRLQYDEDGIINWTDKHTYKDDGTQTVEVLDKEGTPFELRNYRKLSDGRIRRDRYRSGELYRYNLYTEGKCSFSKIEYYRMINQEPVLYRTGISEFNDDCTKETFKLLDANGDLESYFVTTYDRKNSYFSSIRKTVFKELLRGNIIEDKHYDNTDELIYSRSSVYTYNDKNYPITEESTNQDGELSTYKFEYY